MLENDYKSIKVEVILRIKLDTDIEELISNLDYEFKHDSILDTEIINYSNEQN